MIRAGRRSFVRLAVLVVLVLVSGCSIERTWGDSASSRSSLRLVQLGPRAVKASELPDVLSEVARDPAARALLARLHPGPPVEIARVASTSPALDGELMAPPRGGPDHTAIRFADLGTTRLVEDGREIVSLYFDVSRVTLRSGEPEQPLPETTDTHANVDRMLKVAFPFEALAMTIEDLLLRRELGWAVCSSTDVRSTAPEDPAAHRADLDRRIADYARRFAGK